jgi:hypothetical protein
MKSKRATVSKLFPEEKNILSELFPESGKILLTGGGKEFVERIGIEAIRNAVYSVMLGENLRSQTEPISRRRIAQVSGSIVAMFAQGYFAMPDFQEKLSELAATQLKNVRRNDNANVWPAQWLLGLTGKSVQNVLRGDTQDLDEYIKEFENAIKDAAKHCREQIGNYRMQLGYFHDQEGKVAELDWEGITRLTTAIGAQTLAIRGSDKSMYGKLFERLILGSFLTILGFKRVNKKTNKEMQGVFWLSDSAENRESDATLIIRPGKLVRFDIGFIGPGNPEISKDKLSRFANEVIEEGETRSSVTFIVVDRLPQTSKTIEAAKKIGAEIIQMSMQYWPKELCNRLTERFGFENEIQKIDDKDLKEYLRNKLGEIKIQDFLNDVTVEDLSEGKEYLPGEEIQTLAAEDDPLE